MAKTHKTASLPQLNAPKTINHNGRVGKIALWASGKYAVSCEFAQKPYRNSFKTYDAAHRDLIRELSQSSPTESAALHPLRLDRQTYSELEQLLSEKCEGATLRDAVNFYLANHGLAKVKPKTVEDCCAAYLKDRKTHNVTPIHLETVGKHLRRFEGTFGTRLIHEVTALEISEFLVACNDPRTGKQWSAKTRNGNRATLIGLGKYARNFLKALPDSIPKTEFEKVSKAKEDHRGEVEIYTPDEIIILLQAAIEKDIDLIPIIVLGCFQGLRPFEAHGEKLKRPRLKWEDFDWTQNVLKVSGQKVRDKRARHIPIQNNTKQWLLPFRHLSGPIWRHAQAHSKKLIALRKFAKVKSISDGFRHSYASYRLEMKNGDMAFVSNEMGNSPEELIHSYRRLVDSKDASKWFNVSPPTDYEFSIRHALSLKHSA